MTWFNSLELIVPLLLKFRSSITSVFSKNSIIFSFSITSFLKSLSKFPSFRCLPLKKVSRSIRAFWSLSEQNLDVDFSGDRIWSLFVGKTLLILFKNAFPSFAWLTSCNFPRVHFEAEVLSSSLNLARALRSASWFCGVDVLLYLFPSDLTSLLSCVSWSPEKFAGFHIWFCGNAFRVKVVSCFFQIIPCCNGVFKYCVVRKDISRSLSSRQSRHLFHSTSSSLIVKTFSVVDELGRTNLAFTGTCPRLGYPVRVRVFSSTSRESAVVRETIFGYLFLGFVQCNKVRFLILKIFV